MTKNLFTKWKIVFIYCSWMMANLSIIINLGGILLLKVFFGNKRLEQGLIYILQRKFISAVTCNQTVKELKKSTFKNQKLRIHFLIIPEDHKKTNQVISGLQIIFQNLANSMSAKNKILSDIYENLLDINFYKFF